jgi:hypothetical protein
VQEGDATKSELDRARGEQKLLAREVSQIERLNAETMRDAEATTATVQQAKDEAERQRQFDEAQIARLKQKTAQLVKQQRAVQYELTVAKENTAALQELVEVYQKKVRDRAVAGVPSLAEPPAPKPFDPATIPPPQELPPPIPSLEPSKPVPAPAPPSPPVSQKPAPDPKDSGWFSSIKEWVISLWRSVFS